MTDKNYFETEMETIKKMDYIISIDCSYKITDKMETRYLKRCIEECRNIQKGEMALIGRCGMEIDYSQIITLCNLNIIEYMNHVFNSKFANILKNTHLREKLWMIIVMGMVNG